MAGNLFFYPRLRAVNTAGDPIPAARLYVYQAGTAVLADTYTTKDLTVPHANPQIANQAGEFSAIYLDPDAGYDYRFVCQTAAGGHLWTENDVPAGVAASGGSGGGSSGSDGLSVAELRIYQRSETAPATPTGGSFSFAGQSLTPPSGWYADIPAGNSPVYVCAAVAAVVGATGTDVDLDWSAPVVLAQDGSSVNIIFKRAASQPSTPAPSAGIPATWYDDVGSVPSSSDRLWASIGTRDNASQSWVWQLSYPVEGDTGPAGADAVLYYVKSLDGTAIKNGTGSIRLEAHQVFGGNDVLLSSGAVQLYNGSTALGYTETFDSTSIAGAVVVTLKDGPSGNVYDSITLVDVADGAADTGKNAVYGYIEPSNGLAFTRASDGSTWNPAGSTTRLDCTFVQGGAAVARVAWLVTRSSDGILTGATTTHGGGDLNSGRVSVTEINESTQAFTVKFDYSYTGDTASVAETVLTSMAGLDGDPGDPGPTGPGALTLSLTKRHIALFAYQNGSVVSFTDANGLATVYSGTTDVTSSATINAAVASGCTGTINTALNTPVTGAKGYYQVTAMSANTATLTLSATYGGNTATEVVTLSKVNTGYEIVTSLPATNLFAGRVVFLTTDSKLYRYTGTAWTRAVDGADLTANSVTTNAINAGAITAAKIAVTDLSAITANMGTLTAGVARDSSGGAKFDFSNARIVLNTAPGTTGGYVRIMGYGFGPANEYIDWYGAKPSGQSTDSGIIGALTDAGALMFMKTDGTIASRRTRGDFEPKAWCNINGDATPATLRDSFNVASVTRTATGRYTITFASALANDNYCAVTGGSDSAKQTLIRVVAQRTDGLDIATTQRGDGSYTNQTGINVLVFGSNVVGGSNVSTPSGGGGGGTFGWGAIP